MLCSLCQQGTTKYWTCSCGCINCNHINECNQCGLFKPRSSAYKTLDDYVQLHEDITILYVVDGYEAQFNVHDGDVLAAKTKGSTITEALSKLEHLLNTKSLTEWRCTK